MDTKIPKLTATYTPIEYRIFVLWYKVLVLYRYLRAFLKMNVLNISMCKLGKFENRAPV